MSTYLPSKISDFNLVLTEYPKSGGTWLTTLIGTALEIPKRDLYITEEKVSDPNHTFYKGILDHHWYKDSRSGVKLEMPCVIKSHELPHSPLIDFNAKYIHLIRDGRDIVVSRYYYEKDFCLKNGLVSRFDLSFEEVLITVAHEWKNYVNAWQKEKVPTVRYEDLVKDTRKTLTLVLQEHQLDYQDEQVNFAISDNIKDKFSAKLKTLYKHNTFVRKGIVGDWKNHFTKEHLALFYDIAGDLLIQLGYSNYWEVCLSKIKRKYTRLKSAITM